MTVEQVENIIRDFPFATIEKPFIVAEDGAITGSLGILDSSMPNALIFRADIHKVYPYKFQGEEPIHFFNSELIDYPHIMAGGSLCFHTSYWTDEEERLRSDIAQLHKWVKDYFIDGKKDGHYEHIVVENSIVDDRYYAIHFTQPDVYPSEDEYGFAFVSSMRNGIHKEKTVKNLLLNFFGESKKKDIRNCTWGNIYKNQPCDPCPYVILKTIPAIHGKFAPTHFDELEPYFSKEQLSFLHTFEKANFKKYNGHQIPLLIGYKIPNGNLHWQAAIIKVGEFPIHGIPVINNGVKTGEWRTLFNDEKISWAMTFDSSSNLFYGRGAFGEEFTKKNILILGVGAVGSIVAKTLAKCGCHRLTLCDYDIKKPENVCRSEYNFISGACDKSFELAHILSESCPQINVIPLTNEIECLIKSISYNHSLSDKAREMLSQYDVIFDCTTDDDTMVILEQLNISAKVVNISITNHAKELVCAFSPMISSFVKTSFGTILSEDLNDMYEPTGCWSPTFKASYNDIALMVQYAIKHIYRMINEEEPIHNFILRDSENGLQITRY